MAEDGIAAAQADARCHSDEAAALRRDMMHQNNRYVSTLEASDGELQRLTKRNQVLADTVARLTALHQPAEAPQQQQYQQNEQSRPVMTHAHAHAQATTQYSQHPQFSHQDHGIYQNDQNDPIGDYALDGSAADHCAVWGAEQGYHDGMNSIVRIGDDVFEESQEMLEQSAFWEASASSVAAYASTESLGQALRRRQNLKV